MTDSKDTQEEKSKPDRTILPSCLNLDVLRKEQGAQSTEDLKNNVVLYCMKVPKVEDPEEEPSCPRYSCMSGPTQRNCSDINFRQIYHPVQCPKEGQKLQRESLRCRAKSDENHGNIDLCCLPEVLENVTLEDTEEEPRCPSPTMLPLPPLPRPLWILLVATAPPPGATEVPSSTLGYHETPGDHQDLGITKGHQDLGITLGHQPLGPPRATSPWDHQGPPRLGGHQPMGPPRPGITKGHPTSPRATKKLSAMDHQEASGDHQTLKHHWSAPRKLRSFQERRNLGSPTPINTQLCLRTNPDHQPPGLGQESSQGWGIAAGAVGILGAVVGLVFLGYLVVMWWRGRRGQRKWRRSRKKPLRAEEGLGKGQDGDEDTPEM